MDTPTTTATDAPLPMPALGRAFWFLWGATSASNLGDGLYQFLLPVLALQLAASPSEIAGVTVLLTIAWLVFAVPAGSLVDRLDRRMLLLGTTLARIALLALLTGAVFTQQASIPLLYAVALLLGLCETLVDTALTAVMPAVVPAERLTVANARLTAAQTVTNSFIGPPLAGGLLSLGAALASGVSVGLYALAGMLLACMRGRFRVAPASRTSEHTSTWSYLTDGLRYLWRQPLLRSLTLFTAAMNVSWASYTALIVVYAISPGPLRLSPFGYSILLTMLAAGGLSGSLLCERLHKAVGMWRTLLLDVLGTVLLVGVPVLAPHPAAVGLAMFGAGAGSAVWGILVASVRQRVVPAELLGRVYSASRAISWGVGPLGALLAGLAADVWGVTAVFTAATIWAMVVLGLFVLSMTHARRSTLNAILEPNRC